MSVYLYVNVLCLTCVPLVLVIDVGFCFPFGRLGVLFSLSILALFGGGAESSSSVSFFSISDLVPLARICARHFSKPLILHVHPGAS